MDQQTRLTTMVDEALERFAVRDVVSASEVTDLLLDLRLALLENGDPLEELFAPEPARG
ncbi:MAG: hypothetical protein JOZ99_10540 [Actinobacteria bacterium]|nr:hypothetical protein [Actinomycetota bacterium]